MSLLCFRTLLIVFFTCLELSASLTTLLAWSMSDWKRAVSPMDRALTASWTCTTRRSTIWLKKKSQHSVHLLTRWSSTVHIYFLYHHLVSLLTSCLQLMRIPKNMYMYYYIWTIVHCTLHKFDKKNYLGCKYEHTIWFKTQRPIFRITQVR